MLLAVLRCLTSPPLTRALPSSPPAWKAIKRVGTISGILIGFTLVTYVELCLFKEGGKGPH